AVGYFTYKTSEKPTSTAQITPIIAFPHISTYICNAPGNSASMYTGDRVELKYWDGEKYQDEFPAGVSIGWFMIQSCYANGSISKNAKRFYSIRDFNNHAEPRSIALRNQQDGKVVAIGFEDANFNTEPGGSRNGNFGDAVFYLDCGDGESIETGGVPDLPETDIKEEDIHYSVSGVLAFEDNWPHKGDYDMNDVIVSYKREIYKSILTKKVTKLIDTFIAEHNGGLQANGFGYQLTGIPSSTIRQVSIETGGLVSRFMNGQTQEP
ncbi:MAG: LruC domain-containing protein, partial [Bacteroides sp.]